MLLVSFKVLEKRVKNIFCFELIVCFQISTNLIKKYITEIFGESIVTPIILTSAQILSVLFVL